MSGQRPRVWLARDPEKSIRRASAGKGGPVEIDTSLVDEHGELMPPVFGPGTPPPYQVQRLTEYVEEAVLPWSGPDDLVLTVGPTAMVVVIAAALVLRHGRTRLLIYNSQSGRYVANLLCPARR